jgi:hypothetical protein
VLRDRGLDATVLPTRFLGEAAPDDAAPEDATEETPTADTEDSV